MSWNFISFIKRERQENRRFVTQGIIIKVGGGAHTSATKATRRNSFHLEK